MHQKLTWKAASSVVSYANKLILIQSNQVGSNLMKEGVGGSWKLLDTSWRCSIIKLDHLIILIRVGIHVPGSSSSSSHCMWIRVNYKYTYYNWYDHTLITGSVFTAWSSLLTNLFDYLFMTQQVVQCHWNQGDLAANLSRPCQGVGCCCWQFPTDMCVLCSMKCLSSCSQQLMAALGRWWSVKPSVFWPWVMCGLWQIPTHFLSTLSFLNPKTPHPATLCGHSCSLPGHSCTSRF